MTILIITVSVLFIGVIITAVLAFWDWRAWMIRKVGPDYRRGLAHIKENGVWTYRESDLIYEGPDAMSYNRKTKIDGVEQIVTDVVPNKIGFTPDEYTGARVYRVNPGGAIGYSDDADGPAVDYPARLISAHVLGRTASQFAASVTADDGMNWKPILIIGGVVVIIAVVLVFMFNGPLKSKATGTTPGTTPGTTSNTTIMDENKPPSGIIIIEDVENGE